MLEGVHNSFDVLVQSPLIDEFNLADSYTGDLERYDALVRALQDTLETLYIDTGPDNELALFDVLNVTYGIVGEHYDRCQKTGQNPSTRITLTSSLGAITPVAVDRAAASSLPPSPPVPRLAARPSPLPPAV